LTLTNPKGTISKKKKRREKGEEDTQKQGGPIKKLGDHKKEKCPQVKMRSTIRKIKHTKKRLK